MNFNGKVALVTGAAVGIGRATAIVLAQNGAKLIGTKKNPIIVKRGETV